MIVYRTKAFPSGEGGPALAGSDEVGMHPDRYEHKEPWTEKIKQDNSFSICLGLVQTFGAYQPHPPQCAHWGTFPKGEGMALPRQWNRRKINDYLPSDFSISIAAPRRGAEPLFIRKPFASFCWLMNICSALILACVGIFDYSCTKGSCMPSVSYTHLTLPTKA